MSTSSPFAALYRDASGTPVEGSRLPPVIAGFDDEYRAANEAALALARSGRGRLRVRGKDRVSFLHNMLTTDVRSLPVLAGAPAAFLTNKGKLVADLVVLKLEDEVILESEVERVEPLRTALDRYVVADDVTLESLVSQVATFSVEGPQAGEVLHRLGADLASLEALAHLGTSRFEIASEPALVTAWRRELTPRFDVAANVSEAAMLLAKVLVGGAVLGGEQVAETRRIEASRPRFGVDMDETNLPLEVALEDAVSFDKGCYIGQEYVVRLAHRGHLNRKLVGLRLSGLEAPERNALVFLDGPEGAEVGSVTSAAASPSFGCGLAFAHVRREAFDPETPVRVAAGGGRVEATVSTLPFRPVRPFRPFQGSS